MLHLNHTLTISILFDLTTYLYLPLISVHTQSFSFPFLIPCHYSISKDVWTQKSNGFFFLSLSLSLSHAVFPLFLIHHLSHFSFLTNKPFSLIRPLTTPTQCHLPAGHWLPQLVIITVRRGGGPIPKPLPW